MSDAGPTVVSDRIPGGAGDDLAVEAFEHAPALMGVVEPTEDGDVLHVRDNHTACAFFGVEPGGTTGRLASSLGASREALRQWLDHYRASAASQEAQRFEYGYDTPHGRAWLLVAVRQVNHGPSGRARFLYVAEDITARKRAVAELEEARDALQRERDFSAAVVDTAGALVCVIERDGRISRFNRACEATTGFSAAEVCGVNIWESGLIPADQLAGAQETWAELVAGTFPTMHQNEWVARDGSRRLIAWSNTALRGRDGRVEHVIATGIDITDQAAAERKLQGVVEQLRDADRRKDEFLATLAHELRNPLAPIRNAVQILKLKGPADPKLRWGRDVIDRQVQHMARMLEDLLDVSRIAREKLELRREPVQIGGVVDVAIETSRPLLESGHHVLTASVPAEPNWVDGDAVRLAQVFANLLNNAAKYTRDGGKVWLTVTTRDGKVVVSVKDEGIGIPADVLPRVFDIFSQAKPALYRAQGGLGIGLSLVKGLVELHGGKVSAKSEGTDRGSEFLVELPLVPPPHAEAASGDRETATPLQRRVLVADDNADSADSLAMYLELKGSEVQTAYDGEQALAEAERFRPSVMLLDLGMPRLNGYELCRRIRALPWGKGVFIVAMTGWGQDEDRRRTTEAGFDAHLVKPIDLPALMQLLADRLEPSR